MITHLDIKNSSLTPNTPDSDNVRLYFTSGNELAFVDDVGGTTVIPTSSSTTTFTNKAITKRVVTTTDDATAVVDVTSTDVYELYAIANNTTFTFSGTATDGQTITLRFKDAGVSKTLTFTGLTAIGVTLPTATTAGKWHYVVCQYNLAATAWHAIQVNEQV